MNPDQRSRQQGNSPTIPSVNRGPLYMDDEALRRMIDSFGPIEYAQFGPQPESALQWQDDYWPEQGGSSRCPCPGDSAEDSKYLLDEMRESETEDDSTVTQPRQETIIEWFDRSVEKELKKRRESSSANESLVDPALIPIKTKHAMNLLKGTSERLAETSASRNEISTQLETEFTTELTDAVEKLAKAETMCSYVEALQAAEAAANNAPPDKIEEFAAEGARRVQVNASTIKETIPGVRPIEVIGYVGVTKPTCPIKRKD